MLPAASVAVKVTLVSPISNCVGALLVTETEPSILSDAVAAVKNATISVSLAGVPKASLAATVIGSGALITGFTVSAVLAISVMVVLDDDEPAPHPEIRRNTKMQEY